MSRGLLVSQDIFFGSKVTGTAQACGLFCDLASSTERLQKLLAEHQSTEGYQFAILDLECSVATPEALRQLLPAEGPTQLIAYGPHVHIERLESARAAGFDQVLSRGEFSARLPQILQSLVAR